MRKAAVVSMREINCGCVISLMSESRRRAVVADVEAVAGRSGGDKWSASSVIVGVGFPLTGRPAPTLAARIGEVEDQ